MAPAVSRKGRILLVDDVELNRVLTEAVLRSAYDVDCVADGAAALEALDNRSYDLVLMDLEMPGLGGHDTAAAIRQRDGDGVRLAALSSRNTDSARVRSAEVGMAAHIARPIAPHELLRQIEAVFVHGPATPDPWQRADYDEWVARLGAERMLGFLRRLLEQFRDLRKEIADEVPDPQAIERKAHDLASSGGMLGFREVMTCCRAMAPNAAPDPAAPGKLGKALDRAIARLDRYLLNNGDAREG